MVLESADYTNGEHLLVSDIHKTDIRNHYVIWVLSRCHGNDSRIIRIAYLKTRGEVDYERNAKSDTAISLNQTELRVKQCIKFRCRTACKCSINVNIVLLGITIWLGFVIQTYDTKKFSLRRLVVYRI